MPAGTPTDALDASFFTLELTGIEPKLFQNVTLPSIQLAIAESQETGANGVPIKRRTIATTNYSPMQADGGLTELKLLEDWQKAVSDSGVKGQEKDATITAFNTAAQPVAAWKATGCVLESLQVSALKAGDGSHVTFNASFDVLDFERTK